MKSFFKDVYNTLFSDKGIIHLIGIICLVYLLVCWGYSDSAQKTKLFPSSMMASLFKQHVILQILVVTLFSYTVGFLIERAQGIYFGAKPQWTDIIWTTFGGPWGWLAYKLVGFNCLIFGISISVLSIITLSIIWAFYTKIRSQK